MFIFMLLKVAGEFKIIYMFHIPAHVMFLMEQHCPKTFLDC